MATDRLLTIPQVAAIYQVGRATVYRWIAAGRFNRVDVGTGQSKTRIPQSAVDADIARRTISARRAA